MEITNRLYIEKYKNTLGSFNILPNIKIRPNQVYEFIKYCYLQHDIEVNQKYDDKRFGKYLPYSFHLDFAVSQVIRMHKKVFFSDYEKLITILAAAGHDLIEDARLSYNDIVNIVNNHFKVDDIEFKNALGKDVADIIFAVSDEKGKKRSERKNDKYYNELNQNKYAVYVKMCDMIANRGYGMLNNNSMYSSNKNEFSLFEEKLKDHKVEFKYIFDYLRML